MFTSTNSLLDSKASLYIKLNNLKSTINGIHLRIESLLFSRDEPEADIVYYNQQIANQQSRIVELNSQIQSLNLQIENVEKQIQQLTN